MNLVTVERKKTAVLFWAAITLLLAGSFCHARRISVEGVGVSIRRTNRIYRYKSDHLDTNSWTGGLIFPRSSVPSLVDGWEYATHDFRPASEDSRTNDQINRVKADAAGDLLVAMPSASAFGEGWVRLNSGSNADFYLDYATRTGTFTPDTKSPYWFYKHSYPNIGEWVSLPSNSIATDHPPFVFAKIDELYWENPPILPGAVFIARKPEGGGNTTVANPSMVILPNGDYLASISGTIGASDSSIWKSVDRGKSWSLLEDGFSLNRQSVFEHLGSIYLIGSKTRIYKSSNGGVSWASTDFSGSFGYDTPTHIDVVNGRIWKAATVDVSGGTAPGFFSAPADVDLMDESSWMPAEPGATWGAGYGEYSLANGQKADVKYECEGTLLVTREGRLVTATKSEIYRPEDGWKDGIAMIYADQEDFSKTEIDPDYAGPRLPGSNSKYTVRYDPVSKRYWALTSGGINRGELNLYSASSEDGRIGDFGFEKRILEGHSTSYHGFNYPFMQFDGNDIVFVLRTAWDHHRGTSDRWHDADLFTFHRIENFRGNLETDLLVHEDFEEMTIGQPLPGQMPGLGVGLWSQESGANGVVTPSESFGSYYTGDKAVLFDKEAGFTRYVTMTPNFRVGITSGTMYVSYLLNFKQNYPYDSYIQWRTSALEFRSGVYYNGGIGTSIRSATLGGDDSSTLVGNGIFMIINKFDGLGTVNGFAKIWAIDADAYDSIIDDGITEAELDNIAFLQASKVEDATGYVWEPGQEYRFYIGSDAVLLLDELKIGTTLSAVVDNVDRMYGDFTGDGYISLPDLEIYSSFWLKDDCVQTAIIDLDGDCDVDLYEFSKLAKNWLE